MPALKKSLSVFLFFVILFWTLIAISRTLFNVSKIFTEEKKWITMSDHQKREQLYGDIEAIYEAMSTFIMPKDTTYLITTDGKAYFVLRYLLYPKKIYWVNSASEIKKNEKQNFILYYHTKPQNFKNQTELFSDQQGNQYSYFNKL